MTERYEPLFHTIMSILIGFRCGFTIPQIVSKEIRKKVYTNKRKAEKAVPKYYITGDKHRNFKNLILFCKKRKTTIKDTMIILGDAGFNYYGDERDETLKKKLSEVKITLFCIHGNKENRPQNIETYVTKKFRGGIVYYEEKYPNILFSKDCEVYQFDGKSAVIVGGAHSVDKLYRIENGYPWWDDEEPDGVTKERFEEVLSSRNNRIDYIFSHTAPLKYEPTEMFISNGNSEKKKVKKNTFVPDIDKSTELWLDAIEEEVTYEKWFCGHYHTDKSVDDLELMFQGIKELK